MRAAARVQDVRGDRAQLVCEAAPACAGCAGGRGCALRWLSGPGRPELEVPARGADGRRLLRGSCVAVEVADGELLRAAARAYLPPLAGLLGGPAAVVAGAGGELAALAAAVAGLVAGGSVARALLRRRPPRFTVVAGEP
jgi:positive regulator of sigma E activity